MYGHNIVLGLGFAATNILSYVGSEIPFWPIWWSQTGLNSGSYHWLFAATAVLTAAVFVREHHLLSNNLDARTLSGLIAAVALATLGLFNANHGWVRVVHSAGTMVVAPAIINYLRLSPRADRRLLLAMVVAFVVEIVIKKSVPWSPGPWLRDRILMHTWGEVNLLRVSSLAQWAQLLLFAIGTERIPSHPAL